MAERDVGETLPRKLEPEFGTVPALHPRERLGKSVRDVGQRLVLSVYGECADSAHAEEVRNGIAIDLGLAEPQRYYRTRAALYRVQPLEGMVGVKEARREKQAGTENVGPVCPDVAPLAPVGASYQRVQEAGCQIVGPRVAEPGAVLIAEAVVHAYHVIVLVLLYGKRVGPVHIHVARVEIVRFG